MLVEECFCFTYLVIKPGAHQPVAGVRLVSLNYFHADMHVCICECMCLCVYETMSVCVYPQGQGMIGLNLYDWFNNSCYFSVLIYGPCH